MSQDERKGVAGCIFMVAHDYILLLVEKWQRVRPGDSPAFLLLRKSFIQQRSVLDGQKKCR